MCRCRQLFVGIDDWQERVHLRQPAAASTTTSRRHCSTPTTTSATVSGHGQRLRCDSPAKPRPFTLRRQHRRSPAATVDRGRPHRRRRRHTTDDRAPTSTVGPCRPAPPPGRCSTTPSTAAAVCRAAASRAATSNISTRVRRARARTSTSTPAACSTSRSTRDVEEPRTNRSEHQTTAQRL